MLFMQIFSNILALITDIPPQMLPIYEDGSYIILHWYKQQIYYLKMLFMQIFSHILA